MVKLLKNKSGITLVELIVGMVICSMIIAATSAVFAPILKIYEETNEYSELTGLIDNLGTDILNDLSESTEAPEWVDGDLRIVTAAGEVIYTVSDDVADGYLHRNDVLVVSPPFYMRKTLSLNPVEPPLTEQGCYAFTLQLLEEGGNPLITKDFAIRPLALIEYNTN